MHTTRLLTISLALIVAVPVSAQVTIVKGAASSGLARSMNNNSNALALTPDGAMWAVVYLADSAGTNGHLQLRRSTDEGQTWPVSFALPNNKAHNHHHNNSGCIVAGRGGDELHVAWADKTAHASYWSAMYQVFDTKTSKWRGTPTLLAKGYTTNNQFWPVDITVTPKGTVAVCVSGHRAGGLGLGAWDCGLAVRVVGGTFNKTLFNLRRGGASYSQNASICAHDEVIHCCMKNATGGYGICYRAYDTEKKAWQQASQVPVGPSSNNLIAAGNKSTILVDRAGGKYVLYVTGNSSRPRTLRLAYAAPGKGSTNADWKDLHVIKHTTTVGTNYRKVAANSGAYPIIQGGNSTYRNYSLAVGPKRNVFAIYSKAYETFTDLYMQSFRDGVAVLPEIKISAPGSKPYSYEWITGLRNGDHTFTAAWSSFGKTDAPSPNNGTFPNGRVAFHRASGTGSARSIALGTGCQGKLPSRPRIHGHAGLPQLGGAFQVTLDRFPASAGGFLAVGTNMFLPPIQLGFMGASTCFLRHDFPLVVAMQVNASGVLNVSWNVPNDNRLIGVRVYAQSLAIAPNSTPGGVVTSNALAVVFGK